MISAYLKENTKHLHDQVEEKFQSARIFDGTFTFKDYQHLLASNYRLLLNFEKEVFGNISADNRDLLHIEKRSKLPLIESELEAAEVQKSRLCETQSIKNEAEAFGFLYVMEGSTLGGNVIAKQLSKHADFKDISFEYFRCYGENTGFFWKNFKRVLDEEIVCDKYADCINGAKKAYAFLLNLS
ncbi:biliverdin-producing heme oxygenase [Kaistella palustris]|uniref:biliverdin-producing heme oxygenase n=1 Tax=Kaistella palustris TaxID=493376 RepID=UPI00040C5DC0|nr:biliverdin-producing heme oxygenase [Kaistella palustris]